MRKFFKESWAVIGYIFGIIGTAVTIFTVSGAISIGIRWLVIAGFILLSAIIIALRATIKLKNVLRNGTRFEVAAYGTNKNKDVYYTNFSNNLRYGTLVTIYYTVPMTKRLGYGVVRNSSPEEYIEIEILYVEDEFSDIFNQSKTNNGKVLRHMYVLPNTYPEELDTITTLLKGGDSSDGKK